MQSREREDENSDSSRRYSTICTYVSRKIMKKKKHLKSDISQKYEKTTVGNPIKMRIFV